MGMHNESGLKEQFDQEQLNGKQLFVSLQKKVSEYNDGIGNLLKMYYYLFLAILLVFALIFSLVYSKLITEPIVSLSDYIKSFIENNFTYTQEIRVPKKMYEIGDLTLNFVLLRDEIIDQIQNLQERVERRTIDINLKNELLEKQRNDLQKQRDEVMCLNQQMESQQKLLVSQHKDLMSSIRYARNIQDSILPNRKSLKTLFEAPIHFAKPRDVVSGDFLWTYQLPSGEIYFALADCTGHGVPGAFMSLIGSMFLNQAVRDKNLRSTNEILRFLNTTL
jgi:HAMP domain-containing protein